MKKTPDHVDCPKCTDIAFAWETPTDDNPVRLKCDQNGHPFWWACFGGPPQALTDEKFQEFTREYSAERNRKA